MKRTLCAALAVLLLLCLMTPVGAASNTYVRDEASLLTAEQQQDLEQQAATLSADFPCAVYILTMEDFTSVSQTGVYEAATEYYRANALGSGTGKDGVLLLLSMAERDYALISYGDYANGVFSEARRAKVESAFLDDFRDDDWGSGFSDYLSQCRRQLSQAESRASGGLRLSFAGILIALLLGLLISLIVCLILKRNMKSVAIATSARSYLGAGGVHFTVREDRFTHRTETRRHIEPPSSGGGSSHSGGGFSGSSGKF